MLITSKKYLPSKSRLAFDQRAGYHSLVKLACKITHHIFLDLWGRSAHPSLCAPHLRAVLERVPLLHRTATPSDNYLLGFAVLQIFHPVPKVCIWVVYFLRSLGSYSLKIEVFLHVWSIPSHFVFKYCPFPIRSSFSWMCWPHYARSCHLSLSLSHGCSYVFLLCIFSLCTSRVSFFQRYNPTYWMSYSAVQPINFNQ